MSPEFGNQSRDAGRLFRLLARFGYVSKALVYLIIGYIAARAAIIGKGKATDEEGALLTILKQPFGRVLLAVIAAGLFSYALWRFAEAFLDPEGKEEKGSRPWARFQFGISALAYSALGVEAVRMILGHTSKSGGDKDAKEQAGLLLSLPFGHWLTIAIAAFAIICGLSELYKAVERKFEDQWQLEGLGRTTKPWVLRLGRVGVFARAIVGTVVGGYFLLAGLRQSPSEVRGTGGAIESLADRPFGIWILAMIALGLIAYGLYTLAEARYRKMGTS